MSVTSSQADRLIGKVKWFNNKAGYGFITVSSDGDLENKDVFVHYSNINVTNSQYKYLVQGEYVEFTISKTEGGQHEYQATNITGIKGGAIMCETRRISKENAPVRENSDKPKPRSTKPKKKSAPPAENDGFTTVTKKSKKPEA